MCLHRVGTTNNLKEIKMNAFELYEAAFDKNCFYPEYAPDLEQYVAEYIEGWLEIRTSPETIKKIVECFVTFNKLEEEGLANLQAYYYEVQVKLQNIEL